VEKNGLGHMCLNEMKRQIQSCLGEDITEEGKDKFKSQKELTKMLKEGNLDFYIQFAHNNLGDFRRYARDLFPEDERVHTLLDELIPSLDG